MLTWVPWWQCCQNRKSNREENKARKGEKKQAWFIMWKHLCKIIDLCGSIYKEIKSNKIKTKNTLLEKICDPLTTWVTWFVLTCFYSTTLYISVGKLVEDRLETGKEKRKEQTASMWCLGSTQNFLSSQLWGKRKGKLNCRSCVREN